MNESNAIRIADVKYKGDYTLRLRWANDKALTVDLREPVFRLKGMRPLRDTAAFALAGVGEGYRENSHANQTWDSPSRQTACFLAPEAAPVWVRFPSPAPLRLSTWSSQEPLCHAQFGGAALALVLHRTDNAHRRVVYGGLAGGSR
jgi:hypothetical protein